MILLPQPSKVLELHAYEFFFVMQKILIAVKILSIKVYKNAEIAFY